MEFVCSCCVERLHLFLLSRFFLCSASFRSFSSTTYEDDTSTVYKLANCALTYFANEPVCLSYRLIKIDAAVKEKNVVWNCLWFLKFLPINKRQQRSPQVDPLVRIYDME